MRSIKLTSTEIRKVVRYWQESAEEDFELTQHLFAKGSYAYSLFFCHLAIERLLKGLVAQRTGEHAPYTHVLQRLAELTKLTLTEEQKTFLRDLTEWNIRARYPEEKRELFRIATRKYAKRYITFGKKFSAWLRKNYQKK